MCVCVCVCGVCVCACVCVCVCVMKSPAGSLRAVLAMKQKILDQVEAVTSDGGATSGDDLRERYRRQRR